MYAIRNGIVAVIFVFAAAASAADVPIHVAIIGDGRTQAEAACPGSAGWGDSLTQFFRAGVTARNCSAGDLKKALALKPAQVVIGLGQSDADAQTPIVEFARRLHEIVADCRVAGAEVVLVTPPILRKVDPVSGKPFDAKPAPGDAEPYAEAIRDVAQQDKALLLDLRAEMYKTYKEIGDRSIWFIHPPADVTKEPASNVRANKEWRGPKPRNPLYFSPDGADSLAHWLIVLIRAGDSPIKSLLRAPEGPPSADYKLIWSDEFDGTTLDATKWAIRYPGKRKDGINDPQCARLDGEGHLVIDIKKVGDAYHSAMISTGGKKTFRGGYFECRATLPQQPGYWSAFWIIGDHVSDPDRGKAKVDDTLHNGTEIDALEYLQKQGDVVHMNLHWNGYGDTHKSSPGDVFIPGLRAQEWHVFAVDWQSDRYIFYVDGRKTWETHDAPSNADEEILLSVEIGKWAGDIAGAKLPQQVKFDWVRVYQRDANGTPPTPKQ